MNPIGAQENELFSTQSLTSLQFLFVALSEVRIMRLVIPAILFLLLACGPLATAQELRVLSSDAGGCVVEYTPSVRKLNTGNGETLFEIDRGVSFYSLGAPYLFVRTELLGLPAVAGNGVTVLEMDYREESGIRVAMVQESREDDAGAPDRSALYSENAFIPVESAMLRNVGVARDRILGDLVLVPVQWNPATQTARIVTRMRVRIDYGASSERFNPSSVDASAEALLNAEQARRWVLARPPRMTKSAGATMETGNWYRLAAPQTGIYRLTRSWFASAGIDVTSLDPRTIKVYGGGGRELPRDLDVARAQPLMEIAIEVVGGDDGRFDEGDYIQFHGMGTTGFSYNPASKAYSHYINRYTSENAYLLTFGGNAGKRMAREASLSEPGAYRPPWFRGREFEEEDVNSLLNSGLMWFGKRLVANAGSAATITFTRKLHGLVGTEPVLYRVQVAGSSEVDHGFKLRDSEREIGTISLGTVNFNSDTDDVGKISGAREFTGTGQLTDDRSTITFTYSSANADRTRGGYVDWVEWHYARRFEPLNDELLFSAPDTSAVVEFVLNGFTMSEVHVYDITDHSNVLKIDGAIISGGTVRFQIRNEAGRPRQFLAVTGPATKAPGQVRALPNSGLIASQGAEYLIITHDDLVPAAQRLKAHRERPGEEQISSMVVRMSEISNEFASTLPDHTAVRDFLAWALANWQTPPKYVLFLGDGHFDYRNITTKEAILVPVAQSENSINKIDSYVSDDYYVKVRGTGRNDERVDIASGRIPVQTLDEANAVVDKIIRYESEIAFDPWKNRITLVADDGWTSYKDTDFIEHTWQSERMAAVIPPEMEQKKIYIVSYRTENTASGRRKPEAAGDIIDQINRGTLLINYTGHGSHDVWAHERIFINDVTIPQLKNPARLPFFSAATCTFGLYDAPGVRSGTEQLLLKPDGGSIGGLSAPRVVFSHENSAFNREFLDQLLMKGREADGRAKRIGEALYTAKQRYNNSPGYEKFHLFGDPALRIALPRYTAALERVHINGQPASADTVQLRALSKVTLEGSVRRADGSVWEDFNGVTQVSLFDAQRSVVVDEAGWNNFSYPLDGGLLYRGKATISNGRFAINFIIPKDISYENATGRISLYFDNSAVDGAGYFTSLRIGGSDSAAVPDDKGPLITLYMDTRTFQPGDLVNRDALLIADLFDESGINTTGLGIGHDIEAWLDGSGTSIILNEFYTGDVDSYQKGTVEYRFRGLEPGTHTLRLRAYDIFNNSSTAETYFTVAGSSQLTLQDVYNYPNPMKEQTAFTFRHNMGEPVNVDIKVYTLSGRQVRTISAMHIAERFVMVAWDGTDEDGDKLANGVYLYKVICKTIDGGMGSEVLGRLSLLR
jgi:hypothetical protein